MKILKNMRQAGFASSVPWFLTFSSASLRCVLSFAFRLLTSVFLLLRFCVGWAMDPVSLVGGATLQGTQSGAGGAGASGGRVKVGQFPALPDRAVEIESPWTARARERLGWRPEVKIMENYPILAKNRARMGHPTENVLTVQTRDTKRLGQCGDSTRDQDVPVTAVSASIGLRSAGWGDAVVGLG